MNLASQSRIHHTSWCISAARAICRSTAQSRRTSTAMTAPAGFSALLLLASATRTLAGPLQRGEFTLSSNPKATYGQPFTVGDLDAKVSCSCDIDEANNPRVRDVSLVGSVPGGPVDFMYKLTRDIVKDKTQLFLSGNVRDTSISADVDGRDPIKVALEHRINVRGCALQLCPSWLFQSKSALLKMKGAYGGKQKVSGEVEYNTDGELAYEVGYSHAFQPGRAIKATAIPNAREIAVAYSDSQLESGATWTAKSSIKLDALNEVPAVEVSRAWMF
eukprot:6211290-Pleurochrysis_carterae.AAC.1